MSQLPQSPEPLVAIPAGWLRVWATSEHRRYAATRAAWQQARPPARDNPRAQRRAEQVPTGRTGDALRRWLHHQHRPEDLGRRATHRGWLLPAAAVEPRPGGVQVGATADPDARAEAPVLPAGTAWVGTPAGLPLRPRAGRHAVPAETTTVGGEIAALRQRGGVV